MDDDCLEAQLESNRGKHPKQASLTHDESFKRQASEYVGTRKEHRISPWQTSLSGYLRSGKVHICARLWLHELGFKYHQFSKGIYFDGQEQDDVVQHRKNYLATLASLEHRMLSLPIELLHISSNGLLPIVHVLHDESTFHSNADQSFHWTDGL